MKLIIEELEEGTEEMIHDLKNYLKAHDWDFKVEEERDEEQCVFCGGAGTTSLERTDEFEKDVERELLLSCDTCYKGFIKVCKVLRLEEAE